MKLDNNEFNGTSVIADQSFKQQEIVRSRDHRRTTAMLKQISLAFVAVFAIVLGIGGAMFATGLWMMLMMIIDPGVRSALAAYDDAGNHRIEPRLP